MEGRNEKEYIVFCDIVYDRNIMLRVWKRRGRSDPYHTREDLRIDQYIRKISNGNDQGRTEEFKRTAGKRNGGSLSSELAGNLRDPGGSRNDG